MKKESLEKISNYLRLITSTKGNMVIKSKVLSMATKLADDSEVKVQGYNIRIIVRANSREKEMLDVRYNGNEKVTINYKDAVLNNNTTINASFDTEEYNLDMSKTPVYDKTVVENTHKSIEGRTEIDIFAEDCERTFVSNGILNNVNKRTIKSRKNIKTVDAEKLFGYNDESLANGEFEETCASYNLRGAVAKFDTIENRQLVDGKYVLTTTSRYGVHEAPVFTVGTLNVYAKDLSSVNNYDLSEKELIDLKKYQDTGLTAIDVYEAKIK